ncbi:MAG: GC-type dockerin domain-anchored protein [Phycisphaerales bacterium]
MNLFAGAFASGNLLADVDGNGTLNLDDVNTFAMSFVSGCP